MTFKVSGIFQLSSHELNIPCVPRHVGASVNNLRAGTMPLIKIPVCSACRIVHVSDKVSEIIQMKRGMVSSRNLESSWSYIYTYERYTFMKQTKSSENIICTNSLKIKWKQYMLKKISEIKLRGNPTLFLAPLFSPQT